ncbi:hypothetical protein [Pseudoalteromonas sp. bablab_jr011]|uniref:hypothetical protein n=1 Tax=Pseudoalteromonas sp. bablab_jr011 TaxID=2755062 RepID=UPI0018F4AC48|nr:hypothetical protein [Pseudoalteromonas sp. bablab_jr011]
MNTDAKHIPQQLGQYLYQQINDDWSKAMLVLDCQHDEVITCQAFCEIAALVARDAVAIVGKEMKQYWQGNHSKNPAGVIANIIKH